ncbi:hypothetical protein ARSEF4850_009968, partial [Beauveria asiatica]
MSRYSGGIRSVLQALVVSVSMAGRLF